MMPVELDGPKAGPRYFPSIPDQPSGSPARPPWYAGRMATKNAVYVYRRKGMWGIIPNGWVCAHMDYDPKKEDQVMLCDACAALWKAGAEIIKTEEPKPVAKVG